MKQLNLKDIKSMIKTFNRIHKKKINITGTRQQLYNKLLQSWSRLAEQPPFGGSVSSGGRNNTGADEDKWLSANDINKTLKKISITNKNYTFLGSIPIDFHKYFPEIYNIDISKIPETVIGIIFNTGPMIKGEHWVSATIDKTNKTICFYDSVGKKPPLPVLSFFKKFKGYTLYWNRIKRQENHYSCGLYALYFQIERINGNTCQSIFNQNVDDSKVEKLRCKFLY